MVSQLLFPNQPKNFSDIFVIAILALHGLLLYLLRPSLRIPLFAFIFLFWRSCYNIGIGYLLHEQSNHGRLVCWARHSRIFVDPATGKNPHPVLYRWIKRELETKIPKNYKFELAPIEFNTWLVFRRFVDLILMCDFVSYCLFAVACGGTPRGESFGVTVARWITGWMLVGFNLWVKLDAHRVVKDYAWYWGDFFYLIDQELTFDGVFEMAPHPMYSIGYAGYYGISFMAASYNVLFISIIAHAAQFAFLVWVENPHIDKTYNSPLPRKVEDHEEHQVDSETEQAGHINNAPPLASTTQPSPVHNLVGLHNIDLYRLTDTSVILLQLYLFALVALTPSTSFYQTIFVVNAAIWRLWYSIGIGYILNRQSNRKKWTRHFVKYGESTEEAWRQWKGTYHLAMTMCYASFSAAAWKSYTVPNDWGGVVLLKHILGTSLILLHVWTGMSIYESLGEFGWFYGDFFFDHASKLTYSGIYRFLNNPERVIGLAGVWGAVLITGNNAVFFLALLSHILALSFIQFVERPHMQKLYGQSLRRDSGVMKNLKRSLPPPLRKWQSSVDRIFEETLDLVEDFVDSARPKIAAGVITLVKDSTALFKHPTRIIITRLSPDLAGYDPKDYSLEIENTSSIPRTPPKTGRRVSRAMHPSPERRTSFRTLTFGYGEPLKVRWTAPLNHSKKDWVGLYRVADNATRDATRVASQGRWVATNRDKYDSTTADEGLLVSDARISGSRRQDGETKDYFSGEMEFSGEKLWWETGVFEFRYHHDGKHSVMAISLPFEVRIPKFDEDDAEVDSNGSIRGAVEESLLPLIRNCFDRDPEIAPSTASETFGSLIERNNRYAKRVVYAVHQM